MIGRPGAGMAIFNAALEHERSLILATDITQQSIYLNRFKGYLSSPQSLRLTGPEERTAR